MTGRPPWLAFGAALAPALGAVAAAVFGLAGMPDEAKAQCSVLSRQPCLPTNYPPYYPCGISIRPGCMPSILLPLNQVPVIKVEVHSGPGEPPDRDHPADRLDELGPLLSRCLQMPPDDEARPGMRVTIKLAFKRDGELLGQPRFTYTTHEASQEDKVHYHEAAMDMLKRCTPLPITASLAGAIAGRPFVIPITETRTEGRVDDVKSLQGASAPGSPAASGEPTANDAHPQSGDAGK
jgi:hypothetical protein